MQRISPRPLDMYWLCASDVFLLDPFAVAEPERMIGPILQVFREAQWSVDDPVQFRM